jgi:phenylalanyl-tRNA synthetase beta chain
MRVPLEWLHDFCAPDLPVGELATRLALTGTEVDRIDHHGVSQLDAFVVGRVLSAERHPDADRLRVCVVDVGGGEQAQIVCGAPNVAAGQLVAVGRPGAVMPDGTRLGRARLRGVASEGMILAEDELAIGPDHSETLVLGEDGGLAPGRALADVLPIATDVLELEITPNRPDCLGVYGVAREVHAATGAPLAPPPWAHDPGSPEGDVGAQVVVEARDLCPRFTARAFEDVTVGPSPPWLKARLMAAGQRPINNVVDITNYVMLLTGQPLHAFDLDKVAGRRLVVRRARDGEQIVTLDDQTRVLDCGVCLIADDDGPTSIAGVMGGGRSEVEAETTRVLMEVANWVGANIHATSLRLALRSEASARFEKDLPPEAAMEAQAVATALMLEVTGARLVPGTIDVGPGSQPSPPQVVRLRDARMVGLLGVNVTRMEAALHLQRLGFTTAEQPDGLDVTVPHWRRNDVTREADVIEEVARLHGMEDGLPATLPRRRGAVGVLTSGQRLRRRAEDVLADRGLLEIVGWSFEAPERDERLRLPAGDPRRRHVVISNPMSADQSVLRTTLLGSLLDVAAFNRARGAADLALFESGTIYLDRGGLSADGDPVADDAPALVRDNDGPSLAPPDPGEAEAHVSAPAASRPSRGAARATRCGTSSPSRGCSARCSTRCGSRGTSARPVTRSCTPVAPRACSAARPSWAGSARSTRSSRGRGTSRGRSPRSSSTSASSSTRPLPSCTTATSRASPPSARTSPSWSPRTSPPRTWSR